MMLRVGWQRPVCCGFSGGLSLVEKPPWPFPERRPALPSKHVIRTMPCSPFRPGRHSRAGEGPSRPSQHAWSSANATAVSPLLLGLSPARACRKSDRCCFSPSVQARACAWIALLSSPSERTANLTPLPTIDMPCQRVWLHHRPPHLEDQTRQSEPPRVCDAVRGSSRALQSSCQGDRMIWLHAHR